MTSHDCLIRMNALAVDMMHRGSFKESIVVLNENLEGLCGLLRCCSGDRTSSRKVRDFIIISEQIKHFSNTYDDALVSLFCCPFQVLGDRESLVHSIANRFRLASALIYNLGLSHHLCGLQGSDTTQNLLKALDLYRRAAEVLDRIPHLTKYDVCCKLACVANSGHVHSSLADSNAAHSCLLWLEEFFQNPSFGLNSHLENDQLAQLYNSVFVDRFFGSCLLRSAAPAA